MTERQLERLLEMCREINEQLRRLAYAVEDERCSEGSVTCRGCGCRLNDIQDHQCRVCGRLLQHQSDNPHE